MGSIVFLTPQFDRNSLAKFNQDFVFSTILSEIEEEKKPLAAITSTWTIKIRWIFFNHKRCLRMEKVMRAQVSKCLSVGHWTPIGHQADRHCMNWYFFFHYFELRWEITIDHLLPVWTSSGWCSAAKCTYIENVVHAPPKDRNIVENEIECVPVGWFGTRLLGNGFR